MTEAEQIAALQDRVTMLECAVLSLTGAVDDLAASPAHNESELEEMRFDPQAKRLVVPRMVVGA